MSERQPTSTYAAAGVDVDAAEKLVSRFAELAKSARRPEVLADVGPFAGLFRLGSYRDPVLVASTDSVGTKVKLAGLLGRYSGTGHDIVNHCVNDILTSGARPLFFLDYIGNCGLSDDAKADLVRGVAEACKDAGCSLLGGETADMPGTYAEGDFDLAGFIVGLVERDAVIDGSRIERGDALLALASNGLHTNGYSLVRRIFGAGLDRDPAAERAVLETHCAELGETLGDALLRPHRLYLHDIGPLLQPPATNRVLKNEVLPLRPAPPKKKLNLGDTPRPPAGGLRPPALPFFQHPANLGSPIHGIAHITGGGLPGNVPRIMPEGLAACIDRSAWETPPLFRLIQQRGGVADEEMYRTFNMGIGAVVFVAPAGAAAVLARLPGAFVIGEVTEGSGVIWR